jgi:hypothetical protein
MHEVARGEEFVKPAQRDADGRKLDEGRRVEREDHDDGDRRQQKSEDRDVDGEIKHAAGARPLPCGGWTALHVGAVSRT